ncbi:zinc metalloprotease, partial [Xanthovirga aplysinae]|uniref:zinc metalloprotease n=1 Tax=Xanthovirga aplysinae TaxID=2529853 RepID=UPI0012BBE4CA
IFTACSKDKEEVSATDDPSSTPEEPNCDTQRTCASIDVLNTNMEKFPEIRDRMREIEEHTRNFIQRKRTFRTSAEASLNIEIPVVVNVLYNLESENISDEQIQSQIDVLNEDFNFLNEDKDNVPEEFMNSRANIGIHFSLAQIKRKHVSKVEWTPNDDMKSTSKGGLNPVDPERNLNIWVINTFEPQFDTEECQETTLLGYAQFPGGPIQTDGVVVTHLAFGRFGRLYASKAKGRTTTHEVGHWLNLLHIWGDGDCEDDDFVADTPNSDEPNYGCPEYPTVHCGSNDMTMNFMDYTDDDCMYMFTKGQKDRIMALFDAGGARESFVIN